MSTKQINILSLTGAKTAIAAAEARAKQINVPMNIAVVDSGCHLIAFSRMDGAKITSTRKQKCERKADFRQE